MQLIWTCTSFVAKDTTLSFTGLLSLLLLVQAAPSDQQSSNSPFPSLEDMRPAGQLSCSLPRQSGRAPARGRLVGLLTSPVAPRPAGREHGWRPARQGKAQGAASLPGSSHAHELHPSTSSTASPNTLQHYHPFFRSHWSSISSSCAVSHNTFPSFHPP